MWQGVRSKGSGRRGQVEGAKVNIFHFHTTSEMQYGRGDVPYADQTPCNFVHSAISPGGYLFFMPPGE